MDHIHIDICDQISLCNGRHHLITLYVNNDTTISLLMYMLNMQFFVVYVEIACIEPSLYLLYLTENQI